MACIFYYMPYVFFDVSQRGIFVAIFAGGCILFLLLHGGDL